MTTRKRFPVEVNAQIGLYRSVVADKRMLILLDNARDTAQVTPLLTGGSRCAVLTDAEGRQLLTDYLGWSASTSTPPASPTCYRTHTDRRSRSTHPRHSAFPGL
jgi:hypothetical protein